MLNVVEKLFPNVCVGIKYLRKTQFDTDTMIAIVKELEFVARTMEDIAKLQHRIFQKAEQPNSTEQKHGETANKFCSKNPSQEFIDLVDDEFGV